MPDCCDPKKPGLMHVHGPTEGVRLWISLAVTVAFVTIEAISGFYANSLALLSDAGHNAADALALGLAAYAVFIAHKPANERNTFGYQRVGVLSALVNAVSLIVIALVVIGAAVHSLAHSEQINGNLMMAVAAVSFLMNTAIARALQHGASKSLNVKATFLHMVGDALSALAVVVAGLIIRLTGWHYADTIASLLIAGFILYTSWGITVESLNILLEAAPKGLDFTSMVLAIQELEHVEEVHDVHAWSVGDRQHFMSCHVVVDGTRKMDDYADLIGRVNRLLSDQFGIAHTTVQVEPVGTCVCEKDRPVFCGESGISV